MRKLVSLRRTSAATGTRPPYGCAPQAAREPSLARHSNNSPMTQDALTPTPTTSHAPATQVSAKIIAEIQQLLAQAITLADQAKDTLREVVGPQPGQTAQDIITSINQGTGYLRVCRDSIEHKFRKRAKSRLQMSCPHDHGFNPGPRDIYFCKRCDRQFHQQRDGTITPAEIQS